jgi:hypothetical protein
MPVTRALISNVKLFLSPVTKQRFRIERAKYRGQQILSAQAGNDFLAESLAAGRPFAAGKLGAAELDGLTRYERDKDSNGYCAEWGRNATMLHRNAGVYPDSADVFSRFCRVYIESIRAIDALAVWYRFGEHRIQSRYAPHARLVAQTAIEPFYHHRPWSRMLAGKRVLVLTPFAETVHSQGRRLKEVWRAKPDVMPDVELDTLRVPLSAGLVEPVHTDWFSALDALTQEMASRHFDVMIVGAGAWSLPLAARAKQMGKWAIHLGGSTQILFGVKGRRWDSNPLMAEVSNDAWVRPSEAERPRTFQAVEQGCYW